MESKQKKCFIVMPISDTSGYEDGHFARVYEHLIRPACEAAGYSPTRADEVKSTNYIVLDILERIVQSELVICDLSGRNPNVMYELGIRQAFDLPVVLLKDKRTDRVFDIQGLRTLDYDESLRIDRIQKDIGNLQTVIEATSNSNAHDVNSLIKLLSVARASLPGKADISTDTAIVLANLNEISQRLTRIEEKPMLAPSRNSKYATGKFIGPRQIILPSGEKVDLGDQIYDKSSDALLGSLVGMALDGVYIRDAADEVYSIRPDEPQYLNLTNIPF